MSKNKFDDDIIDLKPIPMVYIGEGNWIPLDQTEFLNIEENIYKEDIVTFSHKNKEYKSKIITKYYA